MRRGLIAQARTIGPFPKLAVPIAGDDPEALQVASGLVRDAGFEPVIVGKLADARRFQRGEPGYGQPVTAAELKQKLSLAP
jgi:8-hydroxy-5-deazaflavin:NADPH oxidoreductase